MNHDAYKHSVETECKNDIYKDRLAHRYKDRSLKADLIFFGIVLGAIAIFMTKLYGLW